MDLNMMVLNGRLAAEPEHRVLDSGSRMARLLVAVRSEEPTVDSMSSRSSGGSRRMSSWPLRPMSEAESGSPVRSSVGIGSRRMGDGASWKSLQPTCRCIRTIVSSPNLRLN